MTAALVLAWVAILVLVLAVRGLARRLAEVESVPADVAASAFGISPEGLFPQPLEHALHPDTFGPARSHVVLVVDSGCGTCHELLPHVAELARGADPVERSFHVVTHENGASWADAPVEVVVDDDLVRALDVPWRPGVALVDSAGRVATSRPVGSVEALHAALDEFTARAATGS